MASALTAGERERILELHGQGQSRNAIAAEVGRSPGSVSNVVEGAGLSFARGPQVVAATAARQVDNASRRASMVQRLYDQAERVMGRLEAPTFHALGYDFGKAVVTAVARDAAPAPDVRSLASTAVNLLQAAARLEAVDASKTGTDAGHSAMDAFVTAVREAYDQEGLGDDGTTVG